MAIFKKSLVSTFITLVLLYIGVCVYFYSIQDQILFHPTALSQGFEYTYSFDFEERWFEVADGARIHAIHAKLRIL